MTHHQRKMPKGFTYAPVELDGGVRMPAYDFKQGDLRGRVRPETPKDGGLRHWYGRLWRDGDPRKTLGSVTETTHWEAGDALAAIAVEIDS